MIIPFDRISTSDLIVDAIYEGGSLGNAADDPISKIFPVANQSGFRFKGHYSSPELIVLYSSGHNPDWPDALNKETGIYHIMEIIDNQGENFMILRGKEIVFCDGYSSQY